MRAPLSHISIPLASRFAFIYTPIQLINPPTNPKPKQIADPTDTVNCTVRNTKMAVYDGDGRAVEVRVRVCMRAYHHSDHTAATSLP